MPNEITLSNIWSGRFGSFTTFGGLEDPFLSEALPAFPLTLLPEESYTLALDFVPGLKGSLLMLLRWYQMIQMALRLSISLEWVNMFLSAAVGESSRSTADIIFAVDQSCSMYDDAAIGFVLFNIHLPTQQL